MTCSQGVRILQVAILGFGIFVVCFPLVYRHDGSWRASNI